MSMNVKRDGVSARRAGLWGAAVVALCAGSDRVLGQFMFQRVIDAGVNERAYSIEQTTDGGYVTAGVRTTTAGGQDIFVCRLAPDGSTMWDRIIGGMGNDVGHCVRQTFDGGFIIAAETNSVGAGVGIALVRLSPGGALMWARVYSGTAFIGGRNGVAVREVPDGGFAVVGRVRNVGEAGMGGVLLRTDPVGNIVFNRRYNNPGFGAADVMSFADLRVVSDGFVIVGHDAPSSTAPRDMLLCKINPVGGPVWAIVYGETAFDEEPDSLEATGDGGYAFTARDGGIPSPGGTRFVKTNGAGAQIVSRRYPMFFSAQSALREDIHTDLIIGGNTQFATAAVIAASMVHTAADGSVKMAMAYGGFTAAQREEGEAAIPTRDCGYALAGRSETFAIIPSDKYIVKTNKCLQSGCNESEYFIQEEKRAVPQHAIEQTFTQLTGTVWNPTVAQGSTNRVLCEGPICISDYNCDGFVTGLDFDDYTDDFTAGLIDADINCDGFVTGLDFDDFTDAFVAGC